MAYMKLLQKIKDEDELLQKIQGDSQEELEESKEFKDSVESIQDYVNTLSKDDIIEIVRHIGIIPEEIKPSSTEEKLYSKASDIVLGRCLNEFGLEAKVIAVRGDNADVEAKSRYGRYSLVADAKAFRITRTAKNQKDFKIETLSEWRGANDYAVLVAPYFEYPTLRSRIYASALESNVCLFSWEHILFLLEKNIKESDSLSLGGLWEYLRRLKRDCTTTGSNKQKAPFDMLNDLICQKADCSLDELEEKLKEYSKVRINKGNCAITLYQDEVKRIKALTKEEAIKELLQFRGINNKISEIEKKVAKLEKNNNK